ncbi:MAG: Clp1/GlmU family protein [Fervidicoccaceae archaeon]
MTAPGGRVTLSGYYLAEGPLRLKVVRGLVEVTGKTLEPGSEVVVPAAKATLVETAESEAEVEVRGGSMSKCESSTVPPEWRSFIEELASEKRGLTLLVGPVDSGKTFLATYAANKLMGYSIRVSVIDGDVGQSSIGPPTTVGLGVLESQVAFLEEVEPSAMYFVGSTSPAGHLLPTLVGIAMLREIGSSLSDSVLVDTPGLVFGGPARALHYHLAESLRPTRVALLQHSRELEHLAKLLKSVGVDVLALPASPYARRRSREERRVLRERAFFNYFARRGARELRVDLKRVPLLGSFIGSGEEAPDELRRLVEETLRCRVSYCELSTDSLVVVTDGERSSASREALERLKASLERGEQGPERVVRVLKRGFEEGLVVGLLERGGLCVEVGVLRKLDLGERAAIVLTPLGSLDRVTALRLGSVRLDSNLREVERLDPGFA